jgi:hypothetical protein
LGARWKGTDQFTDHFADLLDLMASHY